MTGIGTPNSHKRIPRAMLPPTLWAATQRLERKPRTTTPVNDIRIRRYSLSGFSYSSPHGHAATPPKAARKPTVTLLHPTSDSFDVV